MIRMRSGAEPPFPSARSREAASPTGMRFIRGVQRHSTVTTSMGSEIPFSETLRGAEKR
jgi:hypothetical protein